MGKPAEHYKDRAARYVVRPQDDQVLRFSSERNSGHSYTTEFTNISISGMAFLVERENAPQVGERIKIEFTVPGEEQIAWFAKVVRVQDCSYEVSWLRGDLDSYENDVIVAISFEDLPAGHQSTIESGLRKKFSQLAAEQRQRQIEQKLAELKQNIGKVLLYLVCAISAIVLLWALTRPTETYDKERGSPWGERFQ